MKFKLFVMKNQPWLSRHPKMHTSNRKHGDVIFGELFRDIESTIRLFGLHGTCEKDRKGPLINCYDYRPLFAGYDSLIKVDDKKNMEYCKIQSIAFQQILTIIKRILFDIIYRKFKVVGGVLTTLKILTNRRLLSDMKKYKKNINFMIKAIVSQDSDRIFRSLDIYTRTYLDNDSSNLLKMLYDQLIPSMVMYDSMKTRIDCITNDCDITETFLKNNGILKTKMPEYITKDAILSIKILKKRLHDRNTSSDENDMFNNYRLWKIELRKDYKIDEIRLHLMREVLCKMYNNLNGKVVLGGELEEFVNLVTDIKSKQ